MKGVTWLRNSHLLFDYESRNVKKTVLQMEGNGIVTINEDFDLDLSEQKRRIQPDISEIMQINRVGGKLNHHSLTLLYRQLSNQRG
jgi:hypothetical protein